MLQWYENENAPEGGTSVKCIYAFGYESAMTRSGMQIRKAEKKIEIKKILMPFLAGRNDELHIILKLRNLEIRKYLSFY